MQRLHDEGRIWYPDSKVKRPQLIRYLDESSGQPATSVWTDISPVNSQAAERVNYDTQKPEALLERIIKASSNEGDLVLDCFVGSGTTAVVAEKLGRRWIGCDLGRFAIHTTRKRLLSVPRVKPFAVQNLGKYERQVWQTAEFQSSGESAIEQQRLRYSDAFLFWGFGFLLLFGRSGTNHKGNRDCEPDEESHLRDRDGCDFTTK